MTHANMWKVALGAAVTSAALFAATAALGETLVQKTVENRVLLAFQVDGAALAEVMPDGWTPITLQGAGNGRQPDPVLLRQAADHRCRGHPGRSCVAAGDGPGGLWHGGRRGGGAQLRDRDLRSAACRRPVRPVRSLRHHP
ncbi:MAG: hypothetical protein R3D59_04245 [Paracoccaceae bacterium]